MRRTFLSVAVVAMGVVVLKLTPVPVSGTASGEAAAQTDPVFKTPWGEPDLQGLWTHDSEIPLQRPAAHAGREFLTDEEIRRD